MEHLIIERHISGDSPRIEHSNFSLFKNRANQWCYSLDVHRYSLLSVGTSGFCKFTHNPEVEKVVKFNFFAKFLNFELCNYKGELERRLTVYLVPECKEEEDILMDAQEAVVSEQWSFRVCFVPLDDFFPEGIKGNPLK
jgi:hypothetical protein